MAAANGRTLRIKLGNGASPEVFATIAGVQECSISGEVGEIDITDKDSSGYRELLAGGIKSVSLKGSGVVKTNALFQLWMAGEIFNAKMEWEDSGDELAGAFQMGTYENTGATKDSAIKRRVHLHTWPIIMWQPFTFAYEGQEIVIPGDQLLRAISVVEDIVTLDELFAMRRENKFKRVKLVDALRALVEFSGSKFDVEKFYRGMHTKEGVLVAVHGTCYALIMLMINPEPVDVSENDEPVVVEKKSSSKKPTKR